MKKLLILSILGILLISISGAQEVCKVARPYFGSVNCEEKSWSEKISIRDDEEWTCEVENCLIDGISVNSLGCTNIFSPISGLKVINEIGSEIIQCDSTIHPLGDECKNYFPRELTKGDKIKVDFYCTLGNPEGNPELYVKYKKLELELNIDSGHSTISNTEFCNVNSVWSQYSKKQLNNNNELKSLSLSNSQEVQGSDGLSNIPSSSNLVSDLKPTQLNYGQGYWFIYDWVERPALIVSSFKNKNVWCNPIDHSLTELTEVNTLGNSCYLIPTTKLPDITQCCSTDECKGNYNNKEVLCTNDFKCGFEKSCLSDLDCGGVSNLCEEKQGQYFTVKSYCDKSEIDSYGKGSCKSEKKVVQCCSGDDGGPNPCGSGSYCDYNAGCTEVSYENTKGDIKTGVQSQKIEENSNNPITGFAVNSQGGINSPNKYIIWYIIIAILIIGIIFMIVKIKRGNREIKISSIGASSNGETCSNCGKINRNLAKYCVGCGKKIGMLKGIKCSKCGSMLEKWRKFCTHCGTKLTKD